MFLFDITFLVSLKKLLSTKTTCLFSLAEKFYEKGYSGIDLIEYISETWDDTNSEKHKILLFLHKIKRDFRNEKVFIYLVLYL